MKKFLSLVLALVMTMSLVTISAGADFEDDNDITYDEAVDVLTALDVVGGYGDDTFRPNAELTRGAAAKIICNLILGPTTAEALPTNSAPFKDVPSGSTFAGYITYCAKEGIIGGYSDGTFKPSAKLTGYAFMKMLLGALGYDASVEGYTGSGWAVSVAKRALNLKLNEGLEGKFNGSKYVTREEACLYAFNTLNAEMVEYDSKSSVSVNGTEIVIAGSDAKATGDTFAEVYFEKLSSDPATDAFGRPATKWKNGKDTIGTYADEADVSYTEKVECKVIYDDLGLSDTAKIADYVVDGDDTATCPLKTISKKDKTEIGGNGVLVEVFYDDDAEEATIVEIHTYFGEVTKVTKATDDDERYVTVDGLKYETENFEKEDLVIYTVDKSESPDEIQTMVLAEKIENVEVTKKSGTSSFVADGVTYKYAADNEITTEIAVDNNVDLYLDAYGYVIAAKINKGTSSDVYVLDIGTDGSRYDGDDTYYAKILKTDGTVEEVELVEFDDKDIVATSPASGEVAIDTVKSQAKGQILEATKNNDDEYSLNKRDNDGTGAVDVNNGESKFTLGGTTYYANSKTVFLVQTGTASKPVYTAYTGYAAVPDLTAASGATYAVYCKTGSVANVVFVKSAVVSSGTNDVVFVLGSKTATTVNDTDLGTYYTYPAVINGEIGTIMMDKTVSGNKLYSSVVYDNDGIMDVDASTEYDTSVDDDYAIVGTSVKAEVEDDTIKLGGAYYAVSEDVEVWKAIKADSIEASSLSDLEVNMTVSYAVVKDGEVVSIFYLVNADSGVVVDPSGSSSGDNVASEVAISYDATNSKYVVNYKIASYAANSAINVAIYTTSGNKVADADVAGADSWTAGTNVAMSTDVPFVAAGTGAGLYDVVITIGTVKTSVRVEVI